MDNRHNPNKPKGMDEMGDRFHALRIDGDDVGPNARYDSLNMSHQYNNHRTAAFNNIKLNPNAREFVPRQSVPQQQQHFGRAPREPVNLMNVVQNRHQHMNSHPQGFMNGHMGNNNHHQVEQQPHAEADIEDYVALSYLKEFINSISEKPNIFERGILDITSIVNSYLDEDECILELIVNQIVDQSIIDVDFRFNGVKLCHHFMEHLRPTRSGQTFKTLLFKRCQRECSREVTKTTTVNTFTHLGGLAMFISDLYSRCGDPELADHLPKLLLNILSGHLKTEDNLKVVCKALKLGGQQLGDYFKSKNNKEVYDKVVATIREKSADEELSNSAKNVAKNVLALVDNGWQESKSAGSNRVNPYLNLDMSSMPPPNQAMMGQNNFGMYDFGDCGDEFDEDVCRSFEQFISSNSSNSDNAVQ